MRHTWEDFLKPILEISKDFKIRRRRDLVEDVANKVGVTSEEKNEMIKSMPRYVNRIGWALTYLTKSNLMIAIKRGEFQITNEGVSFNSSHTDIRENQLKTLPSYQEFKKIKHDKVNDNNENVNELVTTDEMFDNFSLEHITWIKNELLEKLHKIDPYAFESLCVKLLCSIYKINEEKFSEVTQKSNDKGIDGIVYLDQLGLRKVYIQAKRYENNVTDKTIREFVGALHAKGAHEGLIMTTADFTPNAKQAAEKSTTYNIILIGGQEIAQLMIDNEIGVEVESTIKKYKISNDFFDDL